MGKNHSKHSDSTSSIDTEDSMSTGMASNMLHMMNDDVFKKYKILEVLGSGSMGFVAKARIRSKEVGGSAVKKSRISFRKMNSTIQERREIPVFYAIKSIQVDRVSASFMQELNNEIDIMRELDHPNIVRAFEVFKSNRQIYLVMEYCEGGDLYSRGPYSERESATISRSLLSALKYMHDHGVVHRDLKFENIVWEGSGPDAEIKVIDFGLSKKFSYGERDIMSDGVGTMYTMAPQVLQGVYTSQADLWSVGVIIYMLLTSTRPFQHRRVKVLVDKIMRADYVMTGDRWRGISESAKDLVVRLLELDPSIRLNATVALQHPWLEEGLELPNDKRGSVEFRVKDSLATYHNSSQMKKIALNIIAHKSSSKEILELRKCFQRYDTSNDGVIEIHEFRAAMMETNYYSPQEVDDMFASVDVNQNGHIQYTEFLAATLEAYSMIEEERIAEAFDRLDCDSTGSISRENLITFLGRDAALQDVDQLMEEWDTNKDGKLSFREFTQMFRKSTNQTRIQIMDRGLPSDFDATTSEPFNDDELVGLDSRIPGGRHEFGGGYGIADC